MLKLAAATALCAMIMAPAAKAEDLKQPRLISMMGHGEVKAAPDMAVVEMGTVSQASTAKAALDANTKKMTAVMAMLKGAGIDEKDIQTSNFSVNPRYNDNRSANEPLKVIGYEVDNTVIATVRKLDTLGGILDAAVTSGSNQINGITFGIANPQALQDEARKAAVQDAMRKAGILTDTAGVKLGPVITMNENGGVVPYAAPMMRAAKMDAAMAAAPVPVAQGQLQITSDVSMVWQLQ